MIKVVLFDLDDTLISEDSYIQSGYYHVAEAVKKKHAPAAAKWSEQELAKRMYALYLEDSRNVFNRWFEFLDISYTREDVMELVEVYRNHMPDIQFFDDVLPVVNELKKAGIQTGIISDGYLSTQRNKSRVLDLEHIFNRVILTEELGRDYWKPHPRAFEIMKEYFRVNYEEMLYVGDNPKKDFYIKKALPLKTARIIREKSVYEQEAYLEGIREDYRIKSLHEILGLIKFA